MEMNDSRGLEDVLDAFVASSVDQISALDQWIQRYPQYEQELTDFAISWSLMESLPLRPNTEEVDEETLVLRGMNIVHNLLHEQSLEADEGLGAQFESLLTEGQAEGFDPRHLAQVCWAGYYHIPEDGRRPRG